MRSDKPEGALAPTAPESEAFAPSRDEPLLREAADCTPAPLWMTHRNGAMVFANRAFEEQAGQSAEALMGDGWISFLHPDDLGAVREKRAAAWAAGHIAYTFEARFKRYDGVWRWWEVSSRPRFDAKGDFIGYVGLAIDRTEALAAQQALLESEQRYRALIENLPEMVCRFRREGEILFVNPAYARMRGVGVDELVGASFWDFIPQNEHADVLKMMDSLTRESPEVRIENRFRTAAGERWTHWTNRVLAFDDNGRWSEAQSIGVDIHDRRQAEEHRKLLLDELNHRVKNTLAVVQAIAQQSFREAGAPPEARRAFQGRLSAMAQAHNLLTRSHWSPTPLQEVATEAVAVCGAASARIQIGGPAVMLAPRQALSLAMALHELSTNALKYGALSVDTGRVDLKWGLDEDGARIAIVWRERDGPPVTPPAQRGYGSTMIERALAHEIGGAARLKFEPGGVVCEIEAPLTAEAGQ